MSYRNSNIHFCISNTTSNDNKLPYVMDLSNATPFVGAPHETTENNVDAACYTELPSKRRVLSVLITPRTLDTGPAHPRTTAAELFYLHHQRSCAAVASGARGSVAGTARVASNVTWGFLVPHGACDIGLSCAFRASSALTNACIKLCAGSADPHTWLPLFGAIFIANLSGGRISHWEALAASSGLPVHVMAFRAVVNGSGSQCELASVAMLACFGGFHVQPRICQFLSTGVVMCVSGDLRVGTLLACACAWRYPAFPADVPMCPRTATWLAEVMPHRRMCACHGAACKTGFAKGDLRVCNAEGALAHRKWYHPACIEGGLGPFDNVQGAAVLTPEEHTFLREHCDQQGRPTRSDYVEDVRQAKRVCTSPPAPNEALERVHTPLDDSDGLTGELPEDMPLDACSDKLNNLAWWDKVSYEALEHDVHTIGKVPANVNRSLALLRGVAGQALLTAREAGDQAAIARPGKLLTYFDRVLLFQPSRVRGMRRANNSGGLSHVLTRRVRLAWKGDWGALWREAAAIAARAPQPRDKEPSTKQEVKTIEALLADTLVSKASALVTRSAKVVTNAGALPELQALFPDGEPVPRTSPEGPSAEIRQQLVEAVKKAIIHSPKRSGPGLNDSRFEHWSTLLCDDKSTEALAHVVVLFLCGELPEDFMRANLGARMIALRKKNGKLRPVACAGVIRRLVARAACEVFKEEIASACGKHQFAVSRKAGCELVHKSITALTEADPRLAVLAFDASNAFNTIPRSCVLDSVRRRAPSLCRFVEDWLSNQTTHVFWNSEGGAMPIRARSGVDQGCPLSPALFAIGIADAFDNIHARLIQLDPSSRLFSYLDDITVAVPAALSEQALGIVHEEITRVGLVLNRAKTQAWTADPLTPLPQTIVAQRVPTLTCLGNTVSWYDQEDDDEGRVNVQSGSDGKDALSKAEAFAANLARLKAGGLSTESALTLLRTYAQGCSTHLLRANFESSWVDKLDAVLFGSLEMVVGFALDESQRVQATLRLKDGGIAFPSSRATAARAFMGSWALVMQSVVVCLNVDSLEGFRARCPKTVDALQRAEADLVELGGKSHEPFDWASCIAEPRAKMQGICGEALSDHNRKDLLAWLDEEGRLALRSAGGIGAGGFLLPREESDPLIPDQHFVVNLRMRLRAAVFPMGGKCQHLKNDGTLCGDSLDQAGWHAIKCGCGGSRDYRHNSLRDWHAPFHRKHTCHYAVVEQRVPAWDRTDPAIGVVEEARLDVATRDPATAQPVFVDFSVTCEHSDYVPRRRAKSNKDGLAASQAVDKKRLRYPPSGGELVPALVETGGRTSDELLAFARSYGSNLPASERSGVISSFWRQMSRVLAIGNAEMVLSAHQ